METKDRYRQFLENKYSNQYQELLRLEQANKEAMQLPKDSIIIRLESMGFRRAAVNALSDTHYCSTPCDKKGEHSLIVQIGDGVYSKSGEKSISYEQGVDASKSYGQILKEGFYTLDEFDLVLDKMERSHWYRRKTDTKTRLLLSMLQRRVYDALPTIFPWSQGKVIAVDAGMPSRTAQRFFGNHVLFDKVRNGIYMKKIIFDEM